MKSKQKQTYCLGGCHYFNTKNISEYEKINPKTNKLVKIISATCTLCERNISQRFTKSMKRGEDFNLKKGKNKHCSRRR